VVFRRGSYELVSERERSPVCYDILPGGHAGVFPRRGVLHSYAVGLWAVPVRPRPRERASSPPARGAYPSLGLGITTHVRLDIQRFADCQFHPTRERVGFRLETL
jgi:hypothetical protein